MTRPLNKTVQNSLAIKVMAVVTSPNTYVFLSVYGSPAFYISEG